MALADMVTELNGYIDHNPDLAVYRNRVISELNAAYLEFCTSAQWLFLQATQIFSTIAPVEGSSTATVAVTSGAYAVTVTGAVPSASWEGHVFFAPDGEEYEIARVDNTGVAPGNGAFILYSRYAGSTVSGSSSWAVRFLQYALPVDCQEALTIFDIQTRMRLPFIGRGRDEGLAFNRTSAGGPLMAVDTIQRTDRAPDAAPVLAASATAGTLHASETYAVCYTLNVSGREGPPSPVATVTTDGAHQSIAITGLENTRDTGDDTGIWKKVYLRNVTRNGRWLCVNPARADQIAAATTTYTISADVTNTREANELTPSEPFRQYLRMDPPMGDARRLEVRYKRTVRPLAADSDVPLVPPTFERIIVLRAVRRMCLSIGADRLYGIWKAEADELERNCRTVWLTRANLSERRQGIRMPGTGGIDPRLLGTYRLIG